MRWFGPAVLTAAAAVFLVWGWYVASPLWTLHQMRRAAAAGDLARLSAYVDYPALRASQLAARREADRELIASAPPDLRARVVASELARRAERGADPLIGPSYLLIIFRRNPGFSGWASGESDTGRRDAIELRSLDAFHVVNLCSKYPDPEGDLIFRRHGLAWKLAAMGWRQEEFPDGPPRNGWFDRLVCRMRRGR